MCQKFVCEVMTKLLSSLETRVREPALKESTNSPSFTIPTVRHFWYRQNWQRLRLFLSTRQSLFPRQTYFDPFWTVLCKGAQLQTFIIKTSPAWITLRSHCFAGITPTDYWVKHPRFTTEKFTGNWGKFLQSQGFELSSSSRTTQKSSAN